ncbi:hypothetical protein H696_03336 [Fonticula alba]|uniref:Uncharacterized protein n=1 Tax=Fonticula alba TaxID=691883 RepID=A0A058Z6H4_FONAL|nr:hypothetical protein H696_03336 [Fonticula alba]KCV69865.1 hypothetical protein H696_03336 [Fonticula alba]|eukprot:XP_009495471.1 hypothetical protein H696_03336 [Fonticula alba]
MLASTSGPLGGLISYLVMVATGVGPPPWLIGGALATVAGAMCAIALGELLPSAFRSLWFPPTTGSSTPEAAAKLTGSSASAGASRHPFGSKDCCKYITCGQCRRSAPVCAAMGASFQPGPACSGACACHNAIAPPPMAESPPAEPAPESGSAPDVPDGGGPQDKSVVLSPLFLSIFLGMALVGFSMVLGELLLS